MNSRSSTTLRCASAGAALLLASCAMPPGQAWRQIQSQGLIPFIMTDGAPLQVNANQPSGPRYQPMASVTPKVEGPRVYASTPRTRVEKESVAPIVDEAPSIASTPAPAPIQPKAEPMLTAKAVSDLPGYVRSPYTNPPRLVDVRGMDAGSKAVCPYTQKPFLVPAGIKSPAPEAPSTANIAATNPAPAPAPKIKTDVMPNTNVAALNNKPAPAPTSPVVKTEPTPQPKPKVEAPASELPYGTSISGRPGFVNSPYAAKHQLVDVSGLPVGMEVKCPYTGKLFRVPPQ